MATKKNATARQDVDDLRKQLDDAQATVEALRGKIEKMGKEKEMRPFKMLPVPGTGWMMDETGVTWAQYASLVPGTEIPEGKEDYPVWNVNFEDAVRFCNARSKAEGKDEAYVLPDSGDRKGHILLDLNAKGYQLPSSDVRRIATLAGSKGEFCCDEKDLPKYAHYNASGPAPVASKLPNQWGFYDLHGNMWEWCGEVY